MLGKQGNGQSENGESDGQQRVAEPPGTNPAWVCSLKARIIWSHHKNSDMYSAMERPRTLIGGSVKAMLDFKTYYFRRNEPAISTSKWECCVACIYFNDNKNVWHFLI